MTEKSGTPGVQGGRALTALRGFRRLHLTNTGQTAEEGAGGHPAGPPAPASNRKCHRVSPAVTPPEWAESSVSAAGARLRGGLGSTRVLQNAGADAGRSDSPWMARACVRLWGGGRAPGELTGVGGGAGPVRSPLSSVAVTALQVFGSDNF